MSGRLWRQQGVLVLVAGVLLIIATTLIGQADELAEQPPWEAIDPSAVRRLTWALGAAGVATATALVFAVVHVTRVLSLTFKGEAD